MLQIRMFYTQDVAGETQRYVFLGIDELIRELIGLPAYVLDCGNADPWIDGAWNGHELDVHRALQTLEGEHGKYDIDSHIDILLTVSRLVGSNDPGAFFIGLAYGRTAIVSVRNFLPFVGTEGYAELVKQETAHELGHLIGLANRENHSYQSLGSHCVDETCVMHQGLVVPTDWVNMTQSRINLGRYACDFCHADAAADRKGVLFR